MADERNKKDDQSKRGETQPKDQKDMKGREKVGQTQPEKRAGSGQQR